MQKHLAKAREQTQWSETDTNIPVTDGVSIRARIYRPTSHDDDADMPVMMLAHSGGLCMGDLDTETFPCRVLCAQLKVVVIDIDYRLCPEVTFTDAVYDVLNSIKWVSDYSLYQQDISEEHELDRIECLYPPSQPLLWLRHPRCICRRIPGNTSPVPYRSRSVPPTNLWLRPALHRRAT